MLDALVAAGVEVAGVVQRHLVVGGVQRADVDVVQPALAAHEHLVQRPRSARRPAARATPSVVGACPLACGRRRSRCRLRRRAACLSAYAAAASRTHAPFSCAPAPLRDALRRCTGPSPAITRRELVPVRLGRSRGARARRSSAASGSGRVTPSASACGTVMSTKRWRSSSLVCRLIPQAIDCARVGRVGVGRAEHHQRRPPEPVRSTPAPSRAARRCRSSSSSSSS